MINVHSGPNNIAALLIEIAQQDKHDMRTLAKVDERAAEAADAQELSDMERAANYRLASGLTTAAATIAGAGCKFAAADAPSSLQADRDRSGAELAVGIGKMGSSILDRIASNGDIDAKASEQDATRRHEAAQDARKTADDDQGLIEKGIQAVHDMTQATNDAAMAVARMRA